jgi:hypothetical protein
MRNRRRGPRRKITSLSTASTPALDHAPSLADVLKASEHDDEDAAVVPRMVDQPLLEKWSAGYENGGFRVVDGGALLSVKGMPTLFLSEAEKLAAAAEKCREPLPLGERPRLC